MNQLRVFVVDDDADFAESLASILESRDCQVHIAHSGEEAIDIFQEQDFDLTFMDVKLPGKNGVESFLEIRRHKPEARVVMMTGFSMEQLLEQAVENGAYGVLRKPLDLEEVLRMIERVAPRGILIADDDPAFVESVSDYLEGQGRRVFTAQNGQEAIERVRAGGIDVLILDVRMPILDGLQAYIELKQSGHAVPTILVTAYAETEIERVKTLCPRSAGLILRKPFDPRDLLQEIERLFAERAETIS